MRRTILRAFSMYLAAIAISGVHALGASTDFVDITIQGRLTDLNGTVLPNGIYNIRANILDQGGAPAYVKLFSVTVSGGLFTLVVDNVPITALDCDPSLPCAQQVQLTLLDNVSQALPNVTITQTARAGVAARVNGDIETSPGQIEIRSPFLGPSLTHLASDLLMMTDVAGNPAFTVNTEGAIPTLTIANPTVTTFGGQTHFENNVAIDPDNNGTFNAQFGGGVADIRDNLEVGANDNLIVNTTTGITYIDPNGAGTAGIAAVFTPTINFLNNNLQVKPGNSAFPAFDVSGNAVGFNPGVDANYEMFVTTAQVDINRSLNVNSDADATPELEVKSNGETQLHGLVGIDTDDDGEPDIFAVTRNFVPTLEVNGDFTATGTKSFVEPHPTDSALEIAYVSLEGGEAGTYVRGSAQLRDGASTIQLPEHFRLVTNVEGLTAQITPRGPIQSMLYVESVTPSLLVVKSSNPSDGEVAFDYMINGVRRGYEGHQAIRAKQALAQAGQ